MSGRNPCMGCTYWCDCTPSCYYILHTESRRPCPAGVGRTVKTTKDDKKRKSIDWAKERGPAD